MKTTPLPSVEEVRKTHEEYCLGEGGLLLTCDSFDAENVIVKFEQIITQDRDQAYEELIEGIEGMRLEEYHSCAAPPCRDIAYPCEHITEWEVRNKTLNDIIKNLVKPLFNKK